jgi:hypothetical protein
MAATQWEAIYRALGAFYAWHAPDCHFATNRGQFFRWWDGRSNAARRRLVIILPTMVVG